MKFNLKQFRKVGLEDAKTGMERRLACMRTGIPNLVAMELASTWAQQLNLSLEDLDEHIADIEATNLARHYTQTHVLRLGNMKKMQPEGVFQLLGCQMNSVLSTNARLRKMGDIVRLCKEFEIQGGLLSEVGVNWSTFPQSANLASWFRDRIPDIRMHTANNKHEGVAHPQPGGTATFTCGQLVRYVKQKGEDLGCLGQWCSSLIYADPKHHTGIVSAYNVGRQTQKNHYISATTQIHLESRIANNSNQAIHSGFFGTTSSMAVARRQAPNLYGHERHALRDPVARPLTAMGLTEATHHHWGDKEPHTYIGSVEPINGVWHTPDLKVLAVLQLSLHKGVGKHCTVLVNITTYSGIGRQEFKVVHPHTWRLNSTNCRARLRYNRHLEE